MPSPLTHSLFVFVLLAFKVAALPWPGESSSSAEDLTSLDSDFQEDLSGGHYNTQEEILFVVRNGGEGGPAFWALRRTSGTWAIDEKDSKIGKWKISGDSEDITQANHSSSSVFVLDENGLIREYSIATYGNGGSVSPVRSWDLTSSLSTCPQDDGPEGITFVPNSFLASRGFLDGSGLPYPSSRFGNEGLFFLGCQGNGHVYVFDLHPTNSSHIFVGHYVTGQSDTSALDFDRSTGTLFLWHNTGSNYLQLVTNLETLPTTPYRSFQVCYEYTSAQSGNVEGFTVAELASELTPWAWLITDDAGSSGALMFYDSFYPNTSVCPALSTTGTASTTGTTGIETTGTTGIETTGTTGIVTTEAEETITEDDDTEESRAEGLPSSSWFVSIVFLFNVFNK
jgi:hypothetical protein